MTTETVAFTEPTFLEPEEVCHIVQLDSHAVCDPSIHEDCMALYDHCKRVCHGCGRQICPECIQRAR